MLIEYQRLFDGERFGGPGLVEVDGDRITGLSEPGRPADLSCALLLPGLIDAHAAVYGYQEGPPDNDPFQPHRSALALHLRQGVTTVRDPGNTLEVLAYLRTRPVRPRLVVSGPILDGLPLSRAAARLVRDSRELAQALRVLAADGADFLSLGRYLPADLVAEATAAGTPVCVETGVTTPEQAAGAGVAAIEYLPRFLPADAPLLDQLLAWRDDEVAGRAHRLLGSLADRGVALVPLLVAQRRRVVLKEAINEPALDAMVPIMPYHKHLISMRGSVGYAIGKRILNQHMRMPSLDKGQLDQLDAAFGRIGQWLAAAQQRGIPVLAGSGSPGIAAIPGHGLFRELHQLHSLGMPLDATLAAATRHAAQLIGRDDLGRVAPGAIADLLLVDDDPGQDLNELARAPKRVLAGGQLCDPAEAEAL